MLMRLVTCLKSKTQGCLLIILSLTAISSFGCLKTKKVAEASRQKAQEIATQALTERKSSQGNNDPENKNDSANNQNSSNTSQNREEKDAPRPVKENRLYIDASKSMAGFAGHSGDFDKFFSEIGYLLGDPVVYKFGSPTKTPTLKYAELIKATTLGQEQKSPQYYDLYNNPDDVLFTELNQSGTEALSVYISDGVYSASDARAGSKVITPFTDWFKSGRVLGIFVLSSPFKGSFYSEKLCSETNGNKCWLQNVNIPNRPFYAFVFSPNKDAFRKLQKELERKFKSMKTLVFSDDAITSEGLSLPEDDSIYDSSKQSEEYYWQMFTSKLFTVENPAKLSFYLRYAVNKEYPLDKISPKISAKFYLWDDAKSDFVDSDLPSAFKTSIKENQTDQTSYLVPNRPQGSLTHQATLPSVNSPFFMNVALQERSARDKIDPNAKSKMPQSNMPATPKRSPIPASTDDDDSQNPAAPSSSTIPATDEDNVQTAGFQVQIPRDAQSLYDFYYLQIGVEVDAIRPEIESLSTNDDSDPKNAYRTYRFAEVIKALLEAHLQGRLATHVAPPLFLTISN